MSFSPSRHIWPLGLMILAQHCRASSARVPINIHTSPTVILTASTNLVLVCLHLNLARQLSPGPLSMLDLPSVLLGFLCDWQFFQARWQFFSSWFVMWDVLFLLDFEVHTTTDNDLRDRTSSSLALRYLADHRVSASAFNMHADTALHAMPDHQSYVPFMNMRAYFL